MQEPEKVAGRRDGIELIGFARRSITWQIVGGHFAGVEKDEIIVKEPSLGRRQRLQYPEIPGNAIECFRSGDFSGWIIDG